MVNDAGSTAQFEILTGRADPNSGGLAALNDGKLPREEDEPASNFFFAPGSPGGRLLATLPKAVEILSVNTFSWHPGSRGPQVYSLYASEGQNSEFSLKPEIGFDPEKCGWKLLAKVDTRPQTGEVGGQYGVTVSGESTSLGEFRYFLFEISPTETNDPFGNTFFSEIDIIEAHPASAPTYAGVEPARDTQTIITADPRYQVTLDLTETPDLKPWSTNQLIPMIQQWYPRIVAFLPSTNYEAPRKLSIRFKADKPGVADTSGTRITCAAPWFRENLKGEAVGAVFHEMVHVVQQYGNSRRREGSVRPPGWLVEGIPDYIRWYKFEPESHGAEISRARANRVRYSDSYRVTANFLNWVSTKYAADLVPALNAAIREGAYRSEIWEDLTKHKLDDLGEEWKKTLGENAGS